MVEEENVFASKVKHDGIFTFKDFYKFCFDWLSEETGLTTISEEKYAEKLSGETKNVDVEWVCTKDLTDYFREKMKVTFAVKNMSQVKVKRDGVEVDANKGSVEIKLKGILVKDFQGKFDMNAYKKFLRGVYEKHVIVTAVKELKKKVSTDCDEFLGQAKAYLDLEGRKG